MTQRLYYTEPYLTSFDARVERSNATPAGICVVLDRTAFYPTSGGQPYDTGTLGGRRVLDVSDLEDGAVGHIVDGPLEIGGAVHGEIDWPRRFDHMQQHTGQHVLSAAFDRVASARTESFHLGTESAAIDLAREVTPAEIAAAEREANSVVWEDRPIEIRFATAEEAAALPLRKESVRTGRLRLIEIEGFDLSACGGTHVARTGAVGMIAVSGWEKFRNGSRVEFLCGGRALERFHLWRDALAASRRFLSVAPAELASGIERLQGDNKTLARQVRDLQSRLAAFEARALVGRGVRTGPRVAVVESLDGWDAQGLKLMAVAAAQEPGVVAVLFSGSPAVVVVARHPESGTDAGAILKALVGKFGGKGGGKADVAQGGGLNAAPADLVAAARAALDA